MSARQNKKRKTLPRERTVTTLTNGSDPVNITLSPLPPPLAPPFLMSPTFPGSSPNFHYAPFNGFHMGNPMHPVDHQQQFYPQQTTQQMNNMTMNMNHMNILPAGDSDLEILERLKQQIKNGQHQIYRAIPQPIALASLYMGPNAGPPHHPEQPPQDGPKSPIVDPNRTRPPRIQNKDTRTSISTTLSHDSIPSTTTTGMNSIETSDQRTPEYRPLSDRLGPSSPQKPPSQIDRQKLPPPSPATEKSKDPPSRNGSLNIPPSDRHSRDERSHPYDNNTRDRDYHQDRDRNRDLPPRDHRDRDWERDRDRHDRGSRDDRRLDNARRPPPEERHYEPSYSSLPPRRYDPQPPSRTSTLEDIPSGEVSSSNSRDMLPPHRGSSGSLRDAPSSRQPHDDRRAHPPPSPGSTYRPSAARSTGSGDHVSSDRPSATDRSFRSAPSVPPVSATTQDPRSSSASHSSTPLEDRITNQKPTLQDRLHPPMRNDNVPTNSSATTSSARLGRQPSGPSLEERISDPHPPPSSHSSASLPPRPAANTNVGTDSPKTLDNRPRGNLVESERGRPPIPGNARPDRLPAPAPSNAPPRGTSRPPHEERGRSIAAPTTDRNSLRPSSQDRLANNRASVPHPNGYRASSVLRDSDAARAPLPPRVASLSPRRRSLPPRERSPPPRINNYRPDENRYNDNFTRRSSDAMDVDNLHPSHSRYGDNHGRHAYAPSRPFSPPSPEDLARDRERARMAFYPRGSSPPRASTHPHLPPPPPANPAYDDDRRDWSYGSSHDYVHGRRDYEDDYWARAAPPPPVSSSDRDRDRDRDRERYERDIHPLPARGQTWDRDPRDDRDSRDRRRPDSPPPPPRSSYEPPPPSRSLHSRIADSYPPSDRSFAPPPASSAPPPRELDRRFQPPPPSSGPAPPGRGSGGPGSGGVSPPSYSRVRQRSPSPIGRRPPPPSSTNASGGNAMTVDDMRPPPPKRQRDDSYPSSSLPPPPASSSSSSTLPPPPSSSASGYYSPGPGSRGKQEYHHPHMQARIPSPPPPPPPSTGGSVGVGYYERDRERERGRDGYVPPRDYGGRSTYERPRSPPPPPPRGAERAGGGGVYRPANNGSAYVGREDNHRRYMPPPPRTA